LPFSTLHISVWWFERCSPEATGTLLRKSAQPQPVYSAAAETSTIGSR
jgi:hypothetical protein